MEKNPSAANPTDIDPDEPGGGYGLAGLGLLCFCAWLTASADRTTLTAGALVIAGLLMVWSPVRTRISGFCWLAAAVWLVGSFSAFLPANLIATPAWRNLLEAAGIDTGWRITPQPSAALGAMATMTATGIVALWAANQQAGQRRWMGMAFAVAVALYALIAWQGPGLLNHQSNAQGTFGFFPNRNHTATLLVTGAIVSLGLLAQGIRRHRAWQIAGSAVILVFLLGVLFSLSISRAGIVLSTMGGLLWLLLAGKGSLGRHAGKAVALVMGGGLLFFLLIDTPVKRRVDQLLGTVGSEISLAANDSVRPRLETDARIAIFRDTATMIADAPWTGWGQGQFAVIFPQYQDQSRNLSQSQCLHPESDWLWMAAEGGLPATLALAALALGTILPVVRSIRQGRSRAMRAGFLAAALMVPLHGWFDVPGHGFSLLWTSALLLALAAGEGKQPRFPRTSAAGWRLAGLAVAGFGLAILAGERKGHSLLAADRSDTLFGEALELYQQEHLPGAPPPADGSNRLVDALAKLSAASELAPLDQKIPALQGMLALHDDEMDELARKSFARQRALEPNWVTLPLIQAEAWSRINPQETGKLWSEAMRRARSLEKSFPKSRWVAPSYDQILRRARTSPELAGAALDAAGGDPALLQKAEQTLRTKSAEHAR